MNGQYPRTQYLGQNPGKIWLLEQNPGARWTETQSCDYRKKYHKIKHMKGNILFIICLTIKYTLKLGNQKMYIK